MSISEYSIRRPITVVMATISVLLLGYISLQRLPLTMLPEFAGSNLSVWVAYPSSSPEEVERNITRPLEEYLSTLNRLESIESTSSSTGANVRIEFKEGTDMDMAALEVRDRIDQVRNQLPTDVERVAIRRWQTTDMPVFSFAVAWKGSRDELYRAIEDIVRPQLERIEGVANLDVRGVEAKQIVVDLDDRLLQAHGVDVFNLAQALRAANVNVSGGYVIDAGKKYSLRTVGEFKTLEEVQELPILGGRLKLGDVAHARFDFPERDQYSRLNSEEAVTLEVYKTSTANVVSVCRAINKELEAVQQLPILGGRLSAQVFRDQSKSITSTLSDLARSGIFGGMLANIVLFLFLRKLRSTLIVSLAIPVSIIFTCAFMFLLRVFAGSTISLNIVSLMGLMVSVGMLVDCSVVVLENIFRYKQDKGLSALDAALRGSREVGLAVLASTATTVIVFVSFVFLPNSISGRFMADFGIAIAVSLIASLIVAVTLVPMVASRLFTGRERQKSSLIAGLIHWYGNLMKWMVRWRFVTLILMAVIGYGSYRLLSAVDRQFFPSVAERQVRFDVLMERSFSADDMEALFKRIEKTLLDRREELEVVSVSSRYGNRSTSRGQYRGDLTVFLREEGNLIPTNDLKTRIQGLLPDVPGVEYRAGRMRHYGGGREMGVNVELKGDDSALLAVLADEVKARLQQVEGIKDVQSTLETGDDEIHLSVDRLRTEKLGISSLAVARTVSSALSTRAATRMKGDEGEIDVILQLKGNNRVSLAELLNLNLQNRTGEMIPLNTVVNYEYRKGPISIRREDRKAIVSVTGDSRSGASMFVTQEVRSTLSSLHMPAGYSWSLGRDWQRARQGEEESFFAIILAVVLMYMVMAALFESFTHPLTILLTVPFSIIGVAFIFYVTGTSLSQMAYLGILVLFGVVVNNGIILIDHINLLRRSGLNRNEAIVQGGMDRLRPILMTAFTSIFGLLPLALPFFFPRLFGSLEGGAGYWAPVSLAILGGLTTSTFLTLVILPSVYSYMDDLERLVARGFRFMKRGGIQISAALLRRGSAS